MRRRRARGLRSAAWPGDAHRARRRTGRVVHDQPSLRAGRLDGQVRRAQPGPDVEAVLDQRSTHARACCRERPDAGRSLPETRDVPVPLHRREACPEGAPRHVHRRAASPAPPPPRPSRRRPRSATAAVLTPVGTFERPVLVTAPSGDDRVFVVEQTGTVRIVRDGQVARAAVPRSPRPRHVDGRVGAPVDRVRAGLRAERARLRLLQLALGAVRGHPHLRVPARRRRTRTSSTRRPSECSLTIPKPYENHNGGMLQFGPDGYLYASVGDGDPASVNRAGHFAQTLDDLLGNILRIDPRRGDPYAVPAGQPVRRPSTGARPEIWAYGLRNPWRFWIDHPTRTMLIGDAGRHHARGGRPRGARPVGRELRLAVLRGHARLRLDGLVRRRGRPALRLPARQRQLRRDRRRRRARHAHPGARRPVPLRRPVRRDDHRRRAERRDRHGAPTSSR